MKPEEIQYPIIEIPPGRTLNRVQRLRPRSDSVRLNGFILPPKGNPAARFDIPDVSVAYLADSRLTALYETLFRRETQNCTWDHLAARALVEFESTQVLRLADIRGLEEGWPYLVSERIHLTQGHSARWHRAGLDGVIYASAQHPGHACVCLYPDGIRKMKKVESLPLVHDLNQVLLRDVALALNKSGVPLVKS